MHPFDLDNRPNIPSFGHIMLPTTKHPTFEGYVPSCSTNFISHVVLPYLNDFFVSAKTDDIVKSDVWFHFKEGYNNAVRKNVYIADLM